MDCRFCNIDKKRTRIIKEGKYVRVVLSDPRLVDGHLLIIPKRHIEKPSQLNKTEREELFSTVIEFQEKILSKLASGCDVRSNYRPFIKQNEIKVSHLHFHLLPREFEDELYKKCQIFEKDIFRTLTEGEKDPLFCCSILIMQPLVTITNKRQLTIPIQPGTLLDRLSGSIKIPKRFEGLSLEEIIDKAKAEHFEKNKALKFATFDKKLSKIFKSQDWEGD